jgi:hypothetical protein
MSVLFFGFSFSPHILTILPRVSVTMFLARTLRFPQMGTKASILFRRFTKCAHDFQVHRYHGRNMTCGSAARFPQMGSTIN